MFVMTLASVVSCLVSRLVLEPLDLAGMNKLEEKRAVRAGEAYLPPRELDCGSCVLCHLQKNLNEVTAKPSAATEDPE